MLKTRVTQNELSAKVMTIKNYQESADEYTSAFFVRKYLVTSFIKR